MWIYGDREQICDPVTALREAECAWQEAQHYANALARHGARVAAFIQIAGLAQGLGDAELSKPDPYGQHLKEHLTEQSLAATDLLRTLARHIRDHMRGDPIAGDAGVLFRRLERHVKTMHPITIREAEGFAYYGFYPEGWLATAETLSPRQRSAPTHVIGLRSVGTALSAMVAAGLNAASVINIRPVGHHFAREIHVEDDIKALWLSDPTARFAIADEGPGLSGSSFGCVIDWFIAHGVALDRIHAFPSHDQPLGRTASTSHRAQWETISRAVVPTPALWIERDDHWRLSHWFNDVVGPTDKTIENLSGGLWRDGVYNGDDSWVRPACNVSQERMKYRIQAGGRAWLLRFSGLGAHGEEKFERAQTLADAGFIIRPLAFRHGMTIEPWVDATPLPLCPYVPREKLVTHLGRYLGFRAKVFPARDAQGATLERLLDMAVYNMRLGEETRCADDLANLRPHVLSLEHIVRRVVTDNRMQPHEWLVTRDGHLLKTDAVDHASTHDMVGCQDIAWDIAGAIAEFDLSHPERQRLAAIVAHESGHTPCPTLIDVMVPLYLAFQFAAASLAIDTCPLTESESLLKLARHYANRLTRHFAANQQRIPEPAA